MPEGYDPAQDPQQMEDTIPMDAAPAANWESQSSNVEQEPSRIRKIGRAALATIGLTAVAVGGFIAGERAANDGAQDVAAIEEVVTDDSAPATTAQEPAPAAETPAEICAADYSWERETIPHEEYKWNSSEFKAIFEAETPEQALVQSYNWVDSSVTEPVLFKGAYNTMSHMGAVEPVNFDEITLFDEEGCSTEEAAELYATMLNALSTFDINPGTAPADGINTGRDGDQLTYSEGVYGNDELRAGVTWSFTNPDGSTCTVTIMDRCQQPVFHRDCGPPTPPPECVEDCEPPFIPGKTDDGILPGNPNVPADQDPGTPDVPGVGPAGQPPLPTGELPTEEPIAPQPTTPTPAPTPPLPPSDDGEPAPPPVEAPTVPVEDVIDEPEPVTPPPTHTAPQPTRPPAPDANMSSPTTETDTDVQISAPGAPANVDSIIVHEGQTVVSELTNRGMSYEDAISTMEKYSAESGISMNDLQNAGTGEIFNIQVEER